MTDRETALAYFRAYLSEAPLAAAIWRSNEALALHHLDLASPLLDLGCGFGEFARVFFAGKRLPEYGLDIDRGELLRAAPAAAYRALIQGDARRLPFETSSLQSVISISALEHVPDVAPAFTEIARVLRPGGLLAFTVPIETLSNNLAGHALLDRARMRGLADRYAGAVHRRLTHANVWPAIRWAELVTAAGMKIEHATPFVSPGATRAFEALLPAALASRLYRVTFGKRPPHPAPFITLAERGLRRFVGGPNPDGSNLLVVARSAS